jgi:acetyl-CoA carboxylase biotin carboxylase subunit
MFDKILIANRGEIAVRIIRACQEMGIRAVAVYAEADRAALHVRLADEARFIGPAPATESYLSIENILRAARQSGAQAIHPGYGFLSENADFAQAVRQAGLTFIGPSPEATRAMGDKAAARTLMQARGVPIVPGYQEASDDASLERAAEQIGYPILVKAAAGGGGKAMRVVTAPDELVEALGAARREAQHAFGDQRLILEKYVRHARHVEFQIFADRYGHTIHLFERECSVQRRHQKIVEETPSPLLDAKLRAEMGHAAVEAARAVGYENAGTVEFIVDPETRAFYFLEMNTRLQVEHPVTEMTTGLDLVQWQIRVAAGEPLGFAQEELTLRGHAVECRIYAEDPANGFLPSTGCLLQVVEPRRPGLRVDSGFTSGDQVTVHYDPLLSKVIAYAETRAAAIRRMQAALREYVLLGVTTNVDFLQAVLAHSEFQAGRVTTTFIEERLSDWKPGNGAVPPEALIAAALAQIETPAKATTPGAVAASGDPFSPWERGWYPRRATSMKDAK